MFGFAEDAHVVCVQTELVSMFAEREPDVRPYDLITQRLNELALSEKDSTDLVASLSEDYPVDRPVCQRQKAAQRVDGGQQ